MIVLCRSRLRDVFVFVVIEYIVLVTGSEIYNSFNLVRNFGVQVYFGD